MNREQLYLRVYILFLLIVFVIFSLIALNFEIRFIMISLMFILLFLSYLMVRLYLRIQHNLDAKFNQLNCVIEDTNFEIKDLNLKTLKRNKK